MISRGTRAGHPPLAGLTITCCIEFGRLEEQTILMVRSLRKFGGTLADVPVIAVIGRRGAPLRDQTRRELDRLGVRVVRAASSDNPAPWLNYFNKIAAVTTADRLAETDQVAWFDSDIFVREEPTGLVLLDEEELAVRCHFLPPAVFEGDDRNVNFWERICALFDVTFADVPWVEGTEGFPRQKLSFNSGVFTWRRGSGFAQLYADGVKRLLGGRIAQRTGEFFTVDQVVFTPLIVAHDLKWRNLSIADHRLVMGGFLTESSEAAPPLGQARLIHYSNSFAPEYRALMEQKLAREAPTLWAWLQAQHLDLGTPPLMSRAVAGMLKAIRGMRYRLYARSTVRAV